MNKHHQTQTQCTVVRQLQACARAPFSQLLCTVLHCAGRRSHSAGQPACPLVRSGFRCTVVRGMPSQHSAFNSLSSSYTFFLQDSSTARARRTARPHSLAWLPYTPPACPASSAARLAAAAQNPRLLGCGLFGLCHNDPTSQIMRSPQLTVNSIF